MTRHYRALRDDVSNFNWVYGNLIYDERMNPRIQVGNAMLFSTCIKGTESQYTGLKDKNGVEIYEGDICTATFKHRTFLSPLTIKVVYNENVAAFEPVQYWDSQDKWKSVIDGFKNYDIEVIGNIHQHPDLIK
jgi:uncharacterized phage protein (TIGR01671 family)